MTVNAIYWLAIRPELKPYLELLGKGVDTSSEELAEMWGMGGRLGRLIDRYSLVALIRRSRAK